MPVSDALPVSRIERSGSVLRNSLKGADWTGHKFPMPRLAIGHFYLPHDAGDRRLGFAEHLDHYLLYQNFAPVSVGFKVSKDEVSVDIGQYEFQPRDAEDPTLYTFPVPAARSTVGAAQNSSGPIGQLFHGKGRIHTSLKLRRSDGPATVPRVLKLESDGDWELVKCPCCSGSFRMSLVS